MIQPGSPAMKLLEHLVLHELADHRGAVVWPRDSVHIPDDSMIFRVAYMGLEWTQTPEEEIQKRLDDLHRHHGHTRRQFRNGLAFVLPDAEGFGDALRAAEDLLARSGGDALRAAEEARFEGKTLKSLHGRLYQIYAKVYLPGEGQAYLGETMFDVIPLNLQHTEANLHEAVLRRLEPYFRNHLTPEELAWTIGLGRKDCAGFLRVLFPLADVARWFFIFLNLPRLHHVEAMQRCVAEGISQGHFGMLRAEGLLELDHLPEELRARVKIGKPTEPGEIGFESGVYLVWSGALGA